MDINSSYLQNFDLMNDSALAPNSSRPKQKQLEAAQDFEAVFIQSSLKAMRPKLEGGLFNDGLAVDVFYQFMDEAIAKDISRSKNNFGIADALMKQNF
jgi:Rod binding domain-containing protein